MATKSNRKKVKPMKRILYGTTALMAVGLLAGNVGAAEKIKLGLGGYWRAAVHLGNSDSDATGNAATKQRAHGFGQESEIYFSGKTTMDNGVKMGVMVQLEGETSGDQIDNTYIWASGGFGRVEYGETWGVSLMMSAGSVGDLINGHGDFASNGAHPGTNGQFIDTYGGDAGILATPEQKVSYYTPRMGGIQMGVSYVPENNTGGNVTATGLNSELDGTIGNELLDVAVNYVGKMGGTSIRMFGSVFTSKSEGTAPTAATAAVASTADVTTANGDGTNTTVQGTDAVAAVAATAGTAGKDVTGHSLGAQIGFNGFRIGGRITNIDDIAGPGGAPIADSAAGLQRTNWRMGVDYGQGPWRVGVAVMHLEQEVSDGGTGKLARSDETDLMVLSGSYALSPGISVFGGLQSYDFQDSGGPGAGNEADNTVGIIGTVLSF
jgi:hypothetical protein